MCWTVAGWQMKADGLPSAEEWYVVVNLNPKRINSKVFLHASNLRRNF